MRTGVLFVVALLAGCGSGDPAAQSETLGSTDAATLAQAKSHAEGLFPSQELRAGAPPAPVTLVCGTEACVTNQVRLVRQEWPLAWRADYQAMRNVAYCRETTCDGAVQPDQSEACAWRKLIIDRAALQADDTDANNLQRTCDRLEPAAKSLAEEKAKAIGKLLR